MNIDPKECLSRIQSAKGIKEMRLIATELVEALEEACRRIQAAQEALEGEPEEIEITAVEGLSPAVELRRPTKASESAMQNVGAAYGAIVTHNTPLSPDRMWAPTIRALRELAGANTAVVKRWIAENQKEYAAYLEVNEMGTYHNRRHHSGEDIREKVKFDKIG